MFFTRSDGSRFQWDKLFLWGVCIYAVVALARQLLVLYELTDGIAPRLALLFVLVFVATLAGRSLRHSRAVDIAPYALGWMLIAIGLDSLMLAPVYGRSFLGNPEIWVGYVLLFVIPLLAPHTRSRPEPPEIT